MGGGGCGKTTFVKQMKLNYRGGFSYSETNGKQAVLTARVFLPVLSVLRLLKVLPEILF